MFALIDCNNFYASCERVFRPDLNDLHDPFLMKDMRKAIDRIQEAIKNSEKVLIFGDYDVDGTTAVSMVYDFFKEYFGSAFTV